MNNNPWLKPEQNISDETVVVIERGRPYLAKRMRNDFWLETDPDGSIAFGRDGSPIYLSPEWWAPIPK